MTKLVLAIAVLSLLGAAVMFRYSTSAPNQYGNFTKLDRWTGDLYVCGTSTRCVLKDD